MIMKIEKKDIKFQSQMTGQQLVDILTSKYCYIHFDIKLAKMKFWGLRDICCSLVQYIKKYFHKQTKTQENKSVKSNIKKKKNAVPYVPRRGLYRFDANEISDSFESSRAFKMIKTKKISKQEKFVPKIQTRENFKPEQQEKASTKQGFVDDSGDEISSISSNNDSDSIGTIKQFLVNLDPKLQKSINFFARYKKRKEREAQERKNNNLQFKIGIKQNKPISKLRQIPNFMKKTNKIPIYGYESLKQQIIENSQRPKELGYQSLKKQWTKKPY